MAFGTYNDADNRSGAEEETNVYRNRWSAQPMHPTSSVRRCYRKHLNTLRGMYFTLIGDTNEF